MTNYRLFKHKHGRKVYYPGLIEAPSYQGYTPYPQDATKFTNDQKKELGSVNGWNWEVVK